MASTAFLSTDPPAKLVPRLQRCLPWTWEVCDLDGLVYVDHPATGYDELREAVSAALRTVYGEEWRGRVSGFG